MTLKQQVFLSELPKCDFNVTKAAKKAGYAESYATSSLHADLRKSKLLEKYFNEDEIKLDIAKTKKRMRRKGKEDNTNYVRLLELQTKIKGMQVDKSEVKSEVVVKQEEKDELSRIRGILLQPSKS